MMVENVSARRWVRSQKGPSPVTAALAGVFKCISEQTYDCSVESQGCPLVDMSLGAKPYSKPRLPFVISPVVDGAGHMGDEFAHVNSFCRSQEQEDRPEEGESMVAQSSLRVPDPTHDGKLGIKPGSVPPERRILVEAVKPLAKHKELPKSSAEDRIKHAGVPKTFCRRTQYHLRQRQLRTEASLRQAAVESAQMACATAKVSDIQSDQLTPEQTTELQAVIQEHKDQISWDPNDVGCLSDEYKDYYLTIPTVEGAKCKQRPYRLSYKELEAFETQVSLLLRQGILKKANGPTDFLSPVLFVPKPRKPEELRMCVDFRRLNAVSKRDYHALPNIRDLLQSMEGCKYFTALDLTWGFWALPIVEGDQHKTAFTGPDGEVYVWTKAPMGLTNSPAAFQRVMSHVLRGIKGVSVYIDDITIFSKTWLEHLAIIKQVFGRLKQAGLKVKYAKCVWAAAECRVLGSIVSEKGIMPDPDKVAAVNKLPVPRNVADIRSFLGATGYFHEHIQGYADKSAPLRALLKKNVQFLWDKECQRAFEQLKADLVSGACLRMPDPSKPFVLTTDWSKRAVGAVLSQMLPEDPSNPESPDKEYVIAYSSRALNQAESHYAPTEGECLALVWATKKFRQYLHGQKFRVRTDHAALQWLTTARFENSKLERWAMRLQEFDYDVEYLPGNQNVVADHLSRHYSHMEAGSVTAVAGHLAFATEGRVLDIEESGHDFLDPRSWRVNSLQELWSSGDTQAINKQPCTACGAAEGYTHMMLCDTCNRPYHLQCLHPPRSVVPDGEWHCHLCDEAYSNVDELRRTDPILFARRGDPYYHEHAALIRAYVQRQERAIIEYRSSLAAADDFDSVAASQHARARAEEVFHPDMPKSLKRKIRKKSAALRLHPMRPDWLVVLAQLRTGDQLWLAVPPVEFRWGVIASYHDRMGHAGISQTLAVLHQHYHWPGIKADVSAYVEQCHACQVKRLELQQVADVQTPRMSGPFRHVHIDLAGPFTMRRVKDQPVRGKSGRTKATLSTEQSGQGYICLMVDYFTKAAEFAPIIDKSADTVARVVHDSWFMRYGIPEWITTDNGTEFAGAFRHQLERFGIEHIQTSAYHPQSNGAVERLVRTMKSMLAAKVAGAAHDWAALLPQLRMEYMQRRHSVTGYSPNELVHAQRLRLPPPVGPHHTPPQVASVQLPELPEHRHVQQRDQRADEMTSRVYEQILQAQQRNAERQAHLLAARKSGRGRKLQAGDLAYVIERGLGKKNSVTGPFVVESISAGKVFLRTTRKVPDQEVRYFSIHIERVARCTTVTDVLEKLLHAAENPLRLPPDHMVAQQSD